MADCLLFILLAPILLAKLALQPRVELYITEGSPAKWRTRRRL